MPEREIDRRRMLWIGPLTVLAAIGAVLVVRVTAVALLHLPPEGFQPLDWFFPIVDTLILGTAAVVVFAFVARVG